MSPATVAQLLKKQAERNLSEAIEQDDGEGAMFYGVAMQYAIAVLHEKLIELGVTNVVVKSVATVLDITLQDGTELTDMPLAHIVPERGDQMWAFRNGGGPSTPKALALVSILSMKTFDTARPSLMPLPSILRYDKSIARPVACTDNVPGFERTSRWPYVPLFQSAPFEYLAACLTHSSVPARLPVAGPSLFPM